MNIAMTGSTGYIGNHLRKYLSEKFNYRIIPIGRSLLQEDMSALLADTIANCDVVINLAGEPIDSRWTTNRKQELFDSRVTVTHQLVRAINSVKTKPKLMISASAIGYYQDNVESDEYTQERGEGFLSDLCYAWEKEAHHCSSHTRLVITRFGVVLSPDGGAMQKMLLPMHLAKIATAIGPGWQPFSWIAMEDLCRSMEFFIHNEETKGVYNLVAPQAANQLEFAHTMGKAYHAWTTMVVPRWLLKLRYGEAASFLIGGQFVRPTRLLESGFSFSIPTLGKLFKRIDNSTVHQVDLNRYMGVWYEIARFDHRFERGLVDVTATYTLHSDGTIRVENRGRKADASKSDFKVSIGKAKLPNPSQPGKLKVSFFLNIYSDYYILELDEKNYNYVLIGSSSDKYLWILSRTPQLAEEYKRKLVAETENRGYDTSKLIWVDQNIK